MAECADVVVACVGLDATLEGEEGDTGNEFSSGDKPTCVCRRASVFSSGSWRSSASRLLSCLRREARSTLR